MAALTRLAVRTRNATAAEALLDLLATQRGSMLVLPMYVAVLGSRDRFRAELLAVLGRHREALDALDAGLPIDESLGRVPVLRSRLVRARVLVGSGGLATTCDAAKTAGDVARRAGVLGAIRLEREASAFGALLAGPEPSAPVLRVAPGVPVHERPDHERVEVR